MLQGLLDGRLLIVLLAGFFFGSLGLACEAKKETPAAEKKEKAPASGEEAEKGGDPATEQGEPSSEGGEPAAESGEPAAEGGEPGGEEAGDEGGEGAAANAGEGADQLPAVEVAKDGSRFDPPVEAAQIPDGAWICDMGTIHYASLEPGEGTCPICNMKLTQKGASAADHGDHGHAHGEGGHKH